MGLEASGQQEESHLPSTSKIYAHNNPGNPDDGNGTGLRYIPELFEENAGEIGPDGELPELREPPRIMIRPDGSVELNIEWEMPRSTDDGRVPLPRDLN